MTFPLLFLLFASFVLFKLWQSQHRDINSFKDYISKLELQNEGWYENVGLKVEYRRSFISTVKWVGHKEISLSSNGSKECRIKLIHSKLIIQPVHKHLNKLLHGKYGKGVVITKSFVTTFPYSLDFVISDFEVRNVEWYLHIKFNYKGGRGKIQLTGLPEEIKVKIKQDTMISNGK